MKNLFLLFAVALVLGSCNTSYDKTKSGLRYKIVKGKGGEKLKAGDLIKYNQVILIPERDTVIMSTYGKMPGYLQIDTGARAEYTPMEIFPMMSVGDSAVVILSVDSLVKKGMQYNDIFRKGGQVTVRMEVVKKFTSEDEMRKEADKDMAVGQERMKKESELAAANEKKDLEAYLKKNNITTVKTPSGAYVEITEKGNGPAIDTTYDAIVIYTGKLFKDGTQFDSNEGKGVGLKFSPGFKTTVPAFDEGIMYFAKGGKGKIYVPSDLGYGARGSQDGSIPPNSTLVFDVQLHDMQKRTGAPLPMPTQVDIGGGTHSKDDGHGH